MTATQPQRIAQIAPLPTPDALARDLPLSAAIASRIAGQREAIRAILHGEDETRLVVVVGPCSIHNEEAALEYAERLARVAADTSEELVIVMRAYFEKPRTTVGWKGFLNDPELDGSCDLPSGLEHARRLLLAITEKGVACGSEILDPMLVAYLRDCLAWGCIGARTSESQVHRELASGLPMPVGFKNATDGNIEIAQEALVAARHSHVSPQINGEGRLGVRQTPGNPDVHLVLRGGGGIPNYDAEVISWAATRARRLGLHRSVWVDCSHGNSQKNHRLQPHVFRRVLDQVRDGHRAIGGVMLESHLEAGAQPWHPGELLAPGVSITDACIGWEETETLLREAAEAVKASH